MSYSTTRTATFNITSARYLASKIAADLRTMNRFYGHPALADIDNYAEEAALLLRDGYLDRVDYGLRRRLAGEWEWVLRLRYVVTPAGSLQDGNPGGVPATATTAGASFYSYLVKSASYHQLTTEARITVDRALPVSRTGAEETGTAAGTVNGNRTYSRDGTAVTRSAFVAW
jgi:hypothetical protein